MLEAAQRETGLSGQKARDLLGGFLFSGADAQKSLSDISGGEQRRLSLAILVASGANVLILDEPTNHLDVESREALEDALLAFEGAVILVSHDRALLEAVGSRTLVCEDGELRSYPVGWATYQRERDERESGRGRGGQAARRPRASATARPSRRRRRRARRAASPSRSSGRKRSCARSRRSSPTPEPGRRRPRRSRPKSATRRRSGRVAELYERWEAAEAEVSCSGRSSLTRVPLAGGEGDVADLDLLRLWVGGAELGPLEDRRAGRPASRIRRRRRRCSAARRRRRGSRRRCRPCPRGSARAGTPPGSGKRSSR